MAICLLVIMVVYYVKVSLLVDAIEWLSSSGEVIVRQANTNELSLIFAPVNISINNPNICL